MVAPAVRAVVLVAFPFSDLSHSKLRPAVVLADAGREDWILCQITSKPYGDNQAITIEDDGFDTGSLRVVSYMRPGKLFTANNSIMKAQVGILKEEPFEKIINAIVEIFLSSIELDSPPEHEAESE